MLRYQPGDLWVDFTFPADYMAAVAPTGDSRRRTRTPVETPVETPVKTPGRILSILGSRPETTLPEVAAQVGKSLRAVERATAKLVKEGRLRHVGPAKGGHWEILK